MSKSTKNTTPAETTVKVTKVPAGVSGKAFAKAKAKGVEPKAPKARKEKAPKAPKAPKPKKEKVVRPPSHIAKLARMEAALPEATDAVTACFTLATALSEVELAALAARVAFEQKRRGIVGSFERKDQELEVGMTVRIVSGPAKHIGKVGTVDEVRRIRCFVTLPESDTPVYLFRSDVEVIAAADADETTDEGDAEETEESADETESTNILDIADEDSDEAPATGTDNA